MTELLDIKELTGEGEPVELDSHVRIERHEKQCCVSRAQHLHADTHACLTGSKAETTRSLSSPSTEPRQGQGLARGLGCAQAGR